MNFYYNNAADLLPNVDPQNNLEKFVQFPLVRLIIVLALLLGTWLIIAVIKGGIISLLDPASAAYVEYPYILTLIITFLFIYAFYTHTVENRKPLEISSYKFLHELGAGWMLGMTLIGAIVGLLALSGFYKIDQFNSAGNAVHMFFSQMQTGFVEELLFRLILFKLSEELFGSWAAIAIQGVLFGFAHSGNPNATMFSTLALIISFSIFFGAGFMITRRLWFIMSFHWSWNFFQAGIFGMHNSGHEMPSLITPNVEGPGWITGGAWGLELSVISITLLFSISLYFVKLAKDRNQFVKPLWQR